MRLAFTSIVLATLLAGCYFDRLTGNYENVETLDMASDDNSAILEETENDEETKRMHEKRLRELAEEKDPVYRLNAGDEVEIRVYGHDDLGMITKIGPDGMVGFAFMGQVQLSGLTIAEGADKIREGLVPYVKNPVVSITVKAVLGETATITGACAKPGVYGISNNTRLADIYAMAGSSAARLYNGIVVDIADLDHSMVFRNGEILPISFSEAINNGDLLHNIRIRKGDYVHIAQRMEASVTVCGDVRVPQRRPLDPNTGLIEALTTSGWMLETHWKHVIIIRDGLVNPKMYKVDVDGILAGKCRNVILKPGDIVYVPKDNMGEYNVFVRKLMPTAQIINLVSSRVTRRTLLDDVLE